MPNELNTLLADQYKQTLGKVTETVVVDPSALNSEKMAQFRAELRKANLTMEVVKNRIALHALKDAGLKPLVTHESARHVFRGTTGLIFGADGAIDAAKFTTRWLAANKDSIRVKGGLMGPDVLDENGVVQISTLPSRAELLSQMAAGFLAAPQKVAATFQAGYAQVLYAFNALAEKLEKAGK
jgi:ribosomal protein L10